MRVIALTMPSNPTLPMTPTLSGDPTPSVVTTMATLAQTPVVKLANAPTKSIPVTVYNLAQGKFKGVPYPARKCQKEEVPSIPSSNNLLEEHQPKSAATATALHNRENTPWPNTVPASADFIC